MVIIILLLLFLLGRFLFSIFRQWTVSSHWTESEIKECWDWYSLCNRASTWLLCLLHCKRCKNAWYVQLSFRYRCFVKS